MFVVSKYNIILGEDEIIHFTCLTKLDLMMMQENVSICSHLGISFSYVGMW